MARRADRAGPGVPLAPLEATRTRRRRHPLVTLLAVLGALAAIGWFWIWVFSPLFEDPHERMESERAFRRALREVLVGDRGHGGVEVPELPAWPDAAAQDDASRRLVACAERQVARGVRLTTGYHPLRYPWGDVPEHLGSASDLLVRCLRDVGLDLQQMLHVDRVAKPRRYPLGIWGHPRPDRSIDHRRLPNLHAFVAEYMDRLGGLTDSAEKLQSFQPGDVVFWQARGGGEHPGLVGIVLDRRGPDGVPRVATLDPRDRRMTDTHGLRDWPLFARYRLDRDLALERFLEAHPETRLAPPPSRGGDGG